jgi:hypothetical protein
MVDLKLARAMAKEKQLISYDEKTDQFQVFVRAFYGQRVRWDLSIQ